MSKIGRALAVVGEQVADFTRSIIPDWGWFGNGIRSAYRSLGVRFWPQYHPRMEGTQVNYDATRSMYWNDGAISLGAFFCKPIVDLQVGFMGIPTASTDDERLNDFLNECLQDFWVDEIQQMFRDSIRDSKVIVRLQRPDILDPLMTMDEAEHCRLELLPPERVDIERDGANKNIIRRAVVRTRMIIVKDPGDPTKGQDPITEEHDILEIVTPESYRFFDQMTNEWLDELASANPWNFVPFLEVYNEWDAALQGGTSDLETVLPLVTAFHDLTAQGLQAHRYHSTPKVVLNLQEVAPFIKNNFPEAVDEVTGQIMPQAEISWKGREIIFLQQEDKMTFLEAKSVLGDTNMLANFLIDCICIASQTPEWAFMRVDSGSANSDRNAQTVPLIKKVDRKRRNYTKPVQELLKMVMVASGEVPVRVRLAWQTIRVDDEVVEMQAFQQLVMGLEVAAQRGEISDETYRRMLRQYIPVMKNSIQEAADAKDNVVPQLPAAPQPTVVGGPQGRNE